MNEQMSDLPDHPESVEVTYNLSDFNAVTLQRWRYWVTVIGLIAGLVIGIPILFDLLDGGRAACAIECFDWQLPVILILFLTTFVATSAALGYWWAKRKGRIVPTRFLVTEEGVTVENSFAKSFLFWPTLVKVTSTDSRLFLFITRHTAFILPKREFLHEDQFDRWVEIAKRRWSETKSKR